MKTHLLKLPKQLARPACLGALLLAASVHPAHAVVLEQKWVAGQQLAYDVMFNGTANVQTDPKTPSLIAGVPLEIQMQVKGQTTLDTLSVDPTGSATIAPRIGQLEIKADALGMNGELSFKNGRATAFINGQPVPMGRADLSALSNPPVGLRVSRFGGIQGIVPIKQPAPAIAAPPANTNDKKPVKAPFQLDGMVQAVVNNVLMRALPALWTDRDVKAGDTWSGEVRWAVPTVGIPGAGPAVTAPAAETTSAVEGAPAVESAPAAPADPVVGKFDFTLGEEETIENRKVQRIKVQGAVDLTDQLNSPATSQAMAKAAGKTPGQRLISARQKLDGDVWFDTELGQVVRVALNLNVQTRGKNRGTQTPKAAPKTNPRDAKADSWADFTGTFQMQLRKVSLAEVTAPADGAVQ